MAYRFPYTDPRQEGRGWLDFVHAVNQEASESGEERVFTTPVMSDVWHGSPRCVETYPDARVIMPPDSLCEREDPSAANAETVRVVPLTERGASIMARVAPRFRMAPQPVQG